jgi:hypothetical protein
VRAEIMQIAGRIRSAADFPDNNGQSAEDRRGAAFVPIL